MSSIMCSFAFSVGKLTPRSLRGAISTTYGKSKSLINSTTTGNAWLTAMNDAAMDLDMTIQYSMSFTPAIMQSSKLPAVTQIRGSGDYTVGGQQWRVGLTSMYYWALGAVASKDTLWTVDHQPGCPKVAITLSLCCLNQPFSEALGLAAHVLSSALMTKGW